MNSGTGEDESIPSTAATVGRNVLARLGGTLRISAHVLSRFPDQLPSQFAGRLLEASPVERKILEALRSQTTRPWLRPIVPCFERTTGPLVNTLGPHGPDLTAVGITPDGGTVAVGMVNGQIAIWDVHTGTRRSTLPGHGERVTDIFFPRGAPWLLAQSSSQVSLWNLQTGSPVTVFPASASDDARVVCAQDGSRIVVVNANAISFHDVPSGEGASPPETKALPCAALG